MDILSFLVGLLMLLGGAELLVRGAGQIALALRVPVMIVALTIVAFGTSMPEIVVSLTAALAGKPDIALGNVNGSNIANIALVLGVTAVIAPLGVGRELMRREVPTLLVMQVLLLAILWGGEIGRLGGFGLLACGIGYNTWLIRDAVRGRAAVDLDELEEPPASVDPVTNLALVAAGLALLFGGGQFFVDGAVALAKVFGIDDRIIGVTVVALGTSAPELATSMMSAYRNENEMAVGNALGSNIMNLSLALGVSALIHPITPSAGSFNDAVVALLVTLLLVPMVLRGREVSRMEGALLAGAYVVYVVMLSV